MLFLAVFWEMGTRNFAIVSLCYGRSGEEICTGYAMAAKCNMITNKQTNVDWLMVAEPPARRGLRARCHMMGR
jgi:hypothetical protein